MGRISAGQTVKVSVTPGFSPVIER
jgi:hypothetical protein